MTKIRLGLSQVNPIVGDFYKNCKKILLYVKKAKDSEVDVLIFSNMAIIGYPLDGLALKDYFIKKSMLEISNLAHDIHKSGYGGMPIILGHITNGLDGNTPINCISVIYKGQVINVSYRFLSRYPCNKKYETVVNNLDKILYINNLSIAFSEYLPNEMNSKKDYADLNIIFNTSSYQSHENAKKLSLLERMARLTNKVIAHVDLIGAQDGNVFIGNTIIIDSRGKLIGRSQQFVEHLLISDIKINNKKSKNFILNNKKIIDIKTKTKTKRIKIDTYIARNMSNIEEIYNALVLGLHDYAKKNSMRTAILGLSGGIDSALVAAIAADALGGKNIVGVYMPSMYSSNHSQKDAEETAKRIGLDYRIYPINGIFDSFQNTLKLTGTAKENLQSRIRGSILMGISNQENHLVLSTSNKTEILVGYSTIYGDSIGGFAPIKDVEKTLVWKLAIWRNNIAISKQKTYLIPKNSIIKKPSAELKENQFDEDNLPPYNDLDCILRLYINQAKSRQEIIDIGFDKSTVDKIINLIHQSEWKRRQLPIGTNITNVIFEQNNRSPITNFLKYF